MVVAAPVALLVLTGVRVLYVPGMVRDRAFEANPLFLLGFALQSRVHVVGQCWRAGAGCLLGEAHPEDALQV